MPMRTGGSLRTQMLTGAGGLALLALIACGITIYGMLATSAKLSEAAAAESRVALFGTLSARVGDYAVVAVEMANSDALAPAQARARLDSRAAVVGEAFDGLERALGAYVAAAEGDMAANRRATRSLGLARMRARFDRLHDSLTGSDNDGSLTRLRADLDTFATQFSPLLDAAIGNERRTVQGIRAALDTLRGRLIAAALAIGAAALLALAAFHLGVVRPLLARIRQTVAAARRIGAGQFATRLPVGRRDEFGLLLATVNRMAARLDRRERIVAADRAHLNDTIAARTEDLRAANTELEEIDRNRRRFFSDISHELRTPLTVILGQTEIGLRGAGLPEDEHRAALELIHARARRLGRRIDDLLRVARSEGGTIELEERPFDLNDAAALAVEDVTGLAQRHSVRIETALAEEPLPCLGDPDWTRQVVNGLFENAMRHSSPGGRVRLSTEGDASDCTLHVTDEGTGIAPGEREAVFERFRRGSRGRETPGFGVGLALARWVMAEQSGTVSLASPPPVPLDAPCQNPGTRATITLPRLAEA